jgi:flavin reductase (DIM6/NTAB) family NADH-FMN oxidoreductase RutF
MTIDIPHFRQLMGQLASGVSIITTRDSAGTDHGMTVSAFTSLSLSPPMVLVCVDRDATLAPALTEASHLGVSILAATQQHLSQRFAESREDRFSGVEFRRGDSGVALMSGALAQLETRIVAQYPGGDHIIVVCEVVAGATGAGAPLLYHQAAYARLAP